MTNERQDKAVNARDGPMELFKEMSKAFFAFHATMEAAVKARSVNYQWTAPLEKWRSQKLHALAEFAWENNLCEKDIIEFFARHGMSWR